MKRKILEKLNSKQNIQVQYKGKKLRQGKCDMKRETISLTKTVYLKQNIAGYEWG